MGNPRVWDGREWTEITETSEKKHRPVPPSLDGDGSIFVSIVSYRDGERCGETLKSLFDNAKEPDKIVVGLVENNAEADTFCLEQYCNLHGVKIMRRRDIRKDTTKVIIEPKSLDKCPRATSQVRKVAVHHIAAKGPMYSRSLTRKVLGNEDYCMQVDAHSAFVQDWDVLAKEEWNATQNEFAVISNVPTRSSDMSQFTEDAEIFTHVPRQCSIRFQDNGFPDYESPADGKAADLTQPLLSHGWSAGFSFAKCHLEESAPYDPFLHFAMPIEQFSRYARFWTRGYDTYTPTRNLVFHDYGPQENGHGKNEWFKRQRERDRKAAIMRVKTALQMPHEDSEVADSSDTLAQSDAKNMANLGLYGIGKRRSLAQLNDFLHIDLAAGRGNGGGLQGKCANQQWVPYDATISPVANLYDKPDNLDPQPVYPLRTKLQYYKQVAIDVPKINLNLDNPAAAATSDGSIRASGPREEAPPPTPLSFSELFVLWVFGLIVWCVMFTKAHESLMAGGSSGASVGAAVRKRKKATTKDV